MTDQQDVLYKSNKTKRNHKIWKNFVNANFETDNKELIDDFIDFMESDRRLETERPKEYIEGSFAGVSVNILNSARDQPKTKKSVKLKKELFKKLVTKMNQPLKVDSNASPKKRRKSKRQKKLVANQSPAPENPVKPNKINLSAIKSFKKTCARIERKKQNISNKFSKILKSIEVDRPTLLRDKIETLWKPQPNLKEYKSLRWGIEKKKYKRIMQNSDLKQIYTLMLNYIKERAQQKNKILPVEIEINFVDSLKLF